MKDLVSDDWYGKRPFVTVRMSIKSIRQGNIWGHTIGDFMRAALYGNSDSLHTKLEAVTFRANMPRATSSGTCAPLEPN